MRSYPTRGLQRVKRLVRKGRFVIRDNALFQAYSDFGWSNDEITKAILRLRRRDCYKSDPSSAVPGATLDFYRVRGLVGQNVFLHLYVNEEGDVVLNSCKRWEGA